MNASRSSVRDNPAYHDGVEVRRLFDFHIDSFHIGSARSFTVWVVDRNVEDFHADGKSPDYSPVDSAAVSIVIIEIIILGRREERAGVGEGRNLLSCSI